MTPLVNVNKGCTTCAQLPKEIVKIANPYDCQYFSYQAIDRGGSDCNCSGTASGLLRVYVDGILDKTDAISLTCGQQSNVFNYQYNWRVCANLKSGSSVR
ncbi:MAG TPA: hypothetical protein PK598_07215 [Thermoanaerobaculia bacterium]|nr:hypothetical protein [Thermoanaerobaculia bacterium]